MLLRNDLLAYRGPVERTVRLLWLNAAQETAFVIDVYAADAMPEPLHLPAILCDLENGTATVLTTDPYCLPLAIEAIPRAHQVKRDRAWQIIADLVSDEPAIYRPSHRSQRVKSCVQTGQTSLPTLYLYLRRYWQRGQTPNALLPDYAQSGAKGKRREAVTGVKRGRPRKFGEQPGLNISDELRQIFRVAVARYYSMDTKFTLRGAYDQMLKDFFCERNAPSASGEMGHLPKPQFTSTGPPSFGQFCYWLEQDQDRLELKRARLRPRIYDKDLRGLLGTSNAEVWGPGARFQIDATIADVYLVSRINRSHIIGRPVLYVVIDVFSRMIVGLYVGLEGPSWVGAMMALANTAADKQAFCKEFDITITPEEWPCRHLPAVLLGDRGEMEGRMIDTLIHQFNVAVENAAAYRADWKGIVEQRFKLLPAKFKPYVPGYIETDYRARGGRDYRLDAVLDLRQFTQIIIQCVRYYNNQHEFKQYDKDRELIADGVPAVPIDLWEWGVANRSGSLRQYPEVRVLFSLLPVDDATVTVNGIRLQGMFYTCQKAMEERWFDRARQRGTWKVRVSYDPRNLDEIYCHDGAQQFQVCQMTERSRAHRHLSLWEIGQQQQTVKQTSATRAPRQQLASADLAGHLEDIVAKAIAQKPDTDGESAASRTKQVRQHRAAEKDLNRQSEAFRFGQEPQSPKNPANILPFPGSPSDDYDEPDITEIRRTLIDDDDQV